ncbi:hypothetical protein BDV19DRAFT_385512 [Aspergillus venezuelensis]
MASPAGNEATMIPASPYNTNAAAASSRHAPAMVRDDDILTYRAELDRRNIPHGALITFQSLLAISSFEPKAFIHRISPRPLLMVVGELERTIPIDLQLKAFEEAQEPKELYTVKGQGHFRLYHSEGFEENIQVQLRWLKKVFSLSADSR